MSDIRDENPEALREFLDSEKSRPDPPPEVEQRVFSRLAATLALSPQPSAPASPAAPAAKVLGASGVRRVLGIFLVGAAVGAGGYGVLQAVRRQAPAQPAVLPSTLEASAPAPAPLPEPSPPQVESPPTPAPPSRARQPGESRDQRLAAERRLLEQARTALVKRDAASALVSLRRHARVFADGQLAEERDALFIRALVSQGQYAQARERANRFHSQHPRSLFSEVVDQAMRSIP